MNRTGLNLDKQHRFRNISLTAHVLITLEVVKDLAGVNNLNPFCFDFKTIGK